MKEKRHIAVACGGTGGHVMPGLATAMQLRDRGHDVTLWLTGKAVEDQSADSWPGPVVRVPAQGFPTRFSFKGLASAWRLWRAVRICRRRMREDAPDVLLAMGSYASAGPALAAWRLRIPLVLHEANVLPGRAVRLLSRVARAVACHFEETRYYLPGRKLIVTGMPLRRELDPSIRRDPPAGLSGEGFTVLIIGGSSGAHRLNEVVSEALSEITRRKIPVRVLHVSGSKDVDWLRERYQEAGTPAVVYPFVQEIAALYQAADLVVCRAGASTCTELCLFGVPALLVPLPHAANDHQTVNARALEKAGAADVVPEKDVSSTWLADYIAASIQDTARLARMRTALQSRVPEHGAERLADLVEQCAAGDPLPPAGESGDG